MTAPTHQLDLKITITRKIQVYASILALKNRELVGGVMTPPYRKRLSNKLQFETVK